MPLDLDPNHRHYILRTFEKINSVSRDIRK